MHAIGLGGQGLVNATRDETLRRLCIEIYNDAAAELGMTEPTLVADVVDHFTSAGNEVGQVHPDAALGAPAAPRPSSWSTTNTSQGARP